METSQKIAPLDRETKTEKKCPSSRPAFDPGKKLLDPRPVPGRDSETAGISSEQAIERGRTLKPIDLVPDEKRGLLENVELFEDPTDVRDPLLGLWIGHVDKMDEKIGFLDLFQGRPEGIDQIVRQLPDEPDRIGKESPLLSAHLQEPDGRVERREELILDQHLRLGQPVEQGRLSGIGVPDQAEGRPGAAMSSFPLHRSGAPNRLQLPVQAGDPLLDPAPIDLQLGLPRAPSADASGLPRKVAPKPSEARKQVEKLGELDLNLSLTGLGSLRKNIEDELRPVQDLPRKDVRQIPALSRGKLVIEDDRLDAVFLALSGKILRLAAPDVIRRGRRLQTLNGLGGDRRPGAPDELSELFERLGDSRLFLVRKLQTDKKRLFRGAIDGSHPARRGIAPTEVGFGL